MGHARIALTIVMLSGSFGCEVIRDVGDDRIIPIVRDASVPNLDASTDAAVIEPFDPPAQYPGEAASADVFAAFKLDIAGTWYGIVTLQDRARVIQMQLDLDPALGTYHLHCLETESCDPFGLGSSDADGGSFGINYLNQSGTAFGFFAWDGPFFPQRIAFSEMLLQRQKQVLSFRFEPSIGEPGERTAVLVRTPPAPEMDAAVFDDGGMP